VIDRLELEGASDALGIALFNIEGGGEPEVRLDIGAPAVEVVVLAVIFLAACEVSVETDDVAVAGLDPDAAEEAASGTFAVDRRYIEDGGGGVAEEVVADVAKDVVLPVKVVGVHEDHLDKAGLMEVELQAAAEACEERRRLLEEAQLAAVGVALVDLIGAVANDLAELHAAQEVLIGVRDLTDNGVRLHVLDVGFDERRPLLDNLDDLFFATDCLIDQGILAFWPAVSLREGRASSGCFFLPNIERPDAAWEEKAVATKNASSSPAVECFRKIMIYGSCGDLKSSW